VSYSGPNDFSFKNTLNLALMTVLMEPEPWIPVERASEEQTRGASYPE
jgi:hypothetical protein